jgi:hypothetical protein
MNSVNIGLSYIHVYEFQENNLSALKADVDVLDLKITTRHIYNMYMRWSE